MTASSKPLNAVSKAESALCDAFSYGRVRVALNQHPRFTPTIVMMGWVSGI